MNKRYVDGPFQECIPCCVSRFIFSCFTWESRGDGDIKQSYYISEGGKGGSVLGEDKISGGGLHCILHQGLNTLCSGVKRPKLRFAWLAQIQLAPLDKMENYLG